MLCRVQSYKSDKTESVLVMGYTQPVSVSSTGLDAPGIAKILCNGHGFQLVLSVTVFCSV